MNKLHNEIDRFDDEIDLRNIFSIIWNKKLFILSFTSIFAIYSVVYALSIPNVYTSSALLAPASNNSSASSQAGQLSGMGLLGLNVSGNSNSKTQEAVERIKSFQFFSEYFLPNIQLENMMALESWNPNENTLIYDKSLFNVKTKKWTRDVSFPTKIKPSDQEVFEEVYKKILRVSVNKSQGFITLSIDHKSPFIAKKWLNIIILNINESMRELDKEDAQNSINFLNESIKSTTVKSLRDVISTLLENQMQTLMLTYSQKDYIFKAIESPIAPEKKSGPTRYLICILYTFIGGMLSLIAVLVNHYRKSLNS